jgi:hypothetical protein
MRAKEELHKRHWQSIRLEFHTPVHEHLARKADAIIVEAYEAVSKGGV